MVNPQVDCNASLMAEFIHKIMIRMMICHQAWLLWLKCTICVKFYATWCMYDGPNFLLKYNYELKSHEIYNQLIIIMYFKC